MSDEHQCLPNLTECLLEFLKINSSTVVSVKVIKRGLPIIQKTQTHFPFPHLVEQGLEFLESQLSATDNENAAKPTSFPYRALQEEYLQFVERTECLRKTAQTAIPDNQGSHYY